MRIFDYFPAVFACSVTSVVYADDATSTGTNVSTEAQTEQPVAERACVASKTRAVVYRELEVAEQSGRIKRLGRTLYFGN